MSELKDREALIRNIYPTASALTLEALAKTYGWSLTALRTHAANLGVKRDPEAARACRSKSAYIAQARAREYQEAMPGVTPGSDARYARACLDQGGFASFVQHNGTTIFGHAGKVWRCP